MTTAEIMMLLFAWSAYFIWWVFGRCVGIAGNGSVIALGTIAAAVTTVAVLS